MTESKLSYKESWGFIIMLSRVLKFAGVISQEERDDKLYNQLIRHEARIGGKLFGLVPKGRTREFFCLDEDTWIWHEKWTDVMGVQQTSTIRYEVRPDNIVKVQNGKYNYLSKPEASRFFDAVRAYDNQVDRELYARI